jgi:GNAT superfamily N-acetyltransferase
LEITRKPAVDSDTDWARETHHRAYRGVCVRQFGPWDEQGQNRFFEDDWRAGSFEIVLCDGVPCGYWRVGTEPQGICIHELVIDPGFQNRGIGSFLLHHDLTEAQGRFASVRLRTLHQNRALALYLRIGFQESGRTETLTLLKWNPALNPN